MLRTVLPALIGPVLTSGITHLHSTQPIHSPDPHTTWTARSQNLPFHSRRSPVLSRHGMVSSSQPLASEIGLSVLKSGGNAVDAAIAMAAALAVTEPCSTGIGGDCFLLKYDAKSKAVQGLNGSGRAPQKLTLERAKAVSKTDEFPPFHALTVTVPGAVAGWVDAAQHWGTKPLSELLEPAAKLADEGFAVSPITAYHWEKGLNQLQASQNFQELLCRDTDEPPRAGQIFRNPGMARALRMIGAKGKEGFYEGPIAKAIVNEVTSHGGVLCLEDLKAHASTFVDPISTSYRGATLHEIPPSGQGMTALIALNLIKAMERNLKLDLSTIIPGSTDHYHCLIEALRYAFADTRALVCDDMSLELVDGLLCDDYADRRVNQLFSMNQANRSLEKPYPKHSSCTVSFQVVDKEGNAVSMVNSNYMGFGTGLIAKNFGFTLQNRGHNFSLNPDHPNVVSPGKRPFHTIIPAMLTYEDSGELFATYTNMGGFMQPQGHVQLLMNMIVWGMNPQEAIDFPRFCIQDGTKNGKVSLEDGIPASVMNELRSRGHNLDSSTLEGQERSAFGRAQIISRDPRSGVLWGGSDGRADGCAMGW